VLLDYLSLFQPAAATGAGDGASGGYVGRIGGYIPADLPPPSKRLLRLMREAEKKRRRLHELE
jgi:hypothetical protein